MQDIIIFVSLNNIILNEVYIKEIFISHSLCKTMAKGLEESIGEQMAAE